MPILLSLRRNTLPHLSGLMLFLILLLQAAIWYPVFQRMYQKTAYAQAAKARLESQNKQMLSASERLKHARFLENTGFTSQVAKYHQGYVLFWELQGEASVEQWQALEEKIQEKMSLGLIEASWQLAPNGLWKGTLLFQVTQPALNRVYQEWLPTRLRKTTTSISDWELVSTLTMEGKTLALLSHRSIKRWVEVGDWLPSLGVSVSSVSSKGVSFVSDSGDEQALLLRHSTLLME